MPERHPTTSDEFLGHPRGLAVLFGTEMWERFSYYGMRALLVLYMVKYLFEPGHAESVVGYTAIRGGLETLFGPLGTQAFASHIYGLYTGLVYLTPLLGGYLADRVLGARRTVMLGGALMAAGHFMMASEQLLFVALFMLVLGSGAFKPTMSTQVGALYPVGDPRRDRAYSIYYVGINIGAFLAPLVCGTLGETLGWHYGFGAAGIGMLIGLAIYVAGSAHLPPERPMKASPDPASASTHQERRAFVAILVLCIPVTLFWATYEQQGNTIALWADQHTDRGIALFGLAADIPTTWFQAFNPFMIFAFTPLVVALWAHQGARGREPSTVGKMALGCFGVAAAYLVMAAAAASGGRASWTWLFAYFVVITIAELYLSPIGLSLVSKVAPARSVSTMMGLWLGTSFIGNLLSGALGALWERMDKAVFFLVVAAIAGLAGVFIVMVSGRVRDLLGEEPRARR